MRSAAAAYLASFLARASFVPDAVLVDALQVRWQGYTRIKGTACSSLGPAGARGSGLVSSDSLPSSCSPFQACGAYSEKRRQYQCSWGAISMVQLRVSVELPKRIQVTGSPSSQGCR